MDAGYLGVGNMGQPMAEKLLDGGHRLVIHDINETAMRPLLQRQARPAASPQQLAEQSSNAASCSCRCRRWPRSVPWCSATTGCCKATR
jgi:3-hydroxyisobutyrate dehydrogenase-like beta-hydroxyacid dehydrogenase